MYLLVHVCIRMYMYVYKRIAGKLIYACIVCIACILIYSCICTYMIVLYVYVCSFVLYVLYEYAGIACTLMYVCICCLHMLVYVCISQRHSSYTCKYMQRIPVRKYIHDRNNVRICVFLSILDLIHHPFFKYVPIRTTRLTNEGQN